MKRLEELILKLRNLEKEIISTVERVLRENQNIIIDMNVEDQLFEKGINRNGIEIASYAPYSPLTIELKRLKGQPTGRVTLRDEGDFHYSFFVEYSSEGFEVKAGDFKTKFLTDNYGAEILGLTDENVKDLAMNYIAPEIIKLFTQL